MTSDEDDSDLELGEIRNPQVFHVTRGGYSARGKGLQRTPHTDTINKDDYGSESDYDDESDDSLN